MINNTYTVGNEVYRKFYWRGWGYRSDLIDWDYMRRWVLYTPFGCVRVHKILRSDGDRHYHDHPFHFVSLILKGAYLEHRPGHPVTLRRPWSLAVRGATTLHRLKLVGELPVWTLVLASNVLRRWGFQTEDGWVDARDYDAYLERKKFTGARPFGAQVAS